MQKIPIIYSEDYLVELEIVMVGAKAGLFIHTEVRTWNKRVYKELKEKWEEFRQLNTQVIYANPLKENTAKFARLFGFEDYGKVMRHRVWAVG